MQKKALFNLHAMEFSSSLAITNLVLSLPLFFFVDVSQLSWELVFIMFVVSVLSSTAFLFISKGVRHMEISEASPLFVFAPAITTLIAFILLGERIGVQQLIGIAGLIIGAYILETKSKASLLEPFRVMRKSTYIRFIFFALLLYGFSSVLDRVALTTFAVEPLTYIVVVELFIAIEFFILVNIYYGGIRDIRRSFQKTGWWIALVSVFTILYRWFQMSAVQLAYVGLVVAVKRVATLITTLVGGELFHEHNLLRKTIACIVMIGGVLLVIL